MLNLQEKERINRTPISLVRRKSKRVLMVLNNIKLASMIQLF
jgi:hypothetical protein